MLISVICRQIPKVSAAEKFMLLMLVSKHGNQGMFQAGSNGWSKSLGVPEIELAKAFRHLAKAECIEHVSVPAGAKGRPRVEYRWRQEDLARLDRHPKSVGGSGRFEALISQLMADAGVHRPKAPREWTPDGKRVAPSRAGAAKLLNPSNRMVLSVLLAFADSGGVVRGKGTAELAALAGLSAPRFETQIEKLLDLGFVRTYVPGVSGAPLLGVVPGVYFLDLGHMKYERRAIPSIAYACPTDGGLIDYQHRWDGDIRLLIMRAERSLNKKVEEMERAPLAECFRATPGVSREVLHRLARILDTARRQGLRDHLQYVLEFCVSQVMTGHWKEIRKTDPAELTGTFYQVLYPAKRRDADIDEKWTAEAIELLCAYLASRAIDMADHLKKHIVAFQGGGNDSIALFERSPEGYVVLPWVAGTRSNVMIVVATYPNVGMDGRESYLLFPTKRVIGKDGIAYEFDAKNIEQLPNKERAYGVGLFTRPKEKPKAKPSAKKKAKTKAG